jgi:hypothetical protein
MANFNFYSDAGLTQPITTSVRKTSSLVFDGSSGNVDYTIWYGSPVTGRVVQAATNPGSDQIVATVVAATGTLLPEQPDTFCKVALSQSGLDSADQDVPLGVSILGGVSNAVPIWVRENVAWGEGTPATYNNLSIQTNPLAESAA